MYRLIPFLLSPFALADYDVSIGWELIIEYECGVIVSDSGDIERSIYSSSRPVAFNIISDDATITLESYKINAHGITRNQVYLSETPDFGHATNIDSWLDKSLMLDQSTVRSEVYAWIPQEYQMMAGTNEITATWSVRCF